MRLVLIVVSTLWVVGCGAVDENKHLDAANPDVAGPACGNGMVGAGEECDDGANNGPGMACNATCMHNVCGDGDRGPGEMCDMGASNGEALGNCAPDCSKLVDTKHIVLSVNGNNGNLGANAIATADALCPAGYKAMFAIGTARRATTAANDSVAPIDWPIKPYTQYVNSTDQVIWKTNALRLLGVSNGVFTALMNPVTSTAGTGALTGLAQNWTTLAATNCNGWTDPAASHNTGIANLTSIGFINNGGTSPCDVVYKFYCVEQ